MQIRLVKIDLGLARSFEVVKITKSSDSVNASEFLYGISAVRILYSYLAVEAFVNYILHDISNDLSRYREGKHLNKTKYDRDSFIKLSNKYNKQSDCYKALLALDLKDRINLISRILGISKICDEDPMLWQVFLNVNKHIRDKILHPNSDPKEFNQIAQIIYEKDFVILAPNMSEFIIKHFYIKKEKKVPSYLIGRRCFTFKEVLLK